MRPSFRGTSNTASDNSTSPTSSFFKLRTLTVGIINSPNRPATADRRRTQHPVGGLPSAVISFSVSLPSVQPPRYRSHPERRRESSAGYSLHQPGPQSAPLS